MTAKIIVSGKHGAKPSQSRVEWHLTPEDGGCQSVSRIYGSDGALLVTGEPEHYGVSVDVRAVQMLDTGNRVGDRRTIKRQGGPALVEERAA